jgi:hypothetical protein
MTSVKIIILKPWEYLKNMWYGFKYATVNILPTKVFINVAKVLPIGDWLQHEDDPIQGNSLINAVHDNDIKTIDAILQNTSKEIIYQMLLQEDCIGLGAIQVATFSKRNIIILKKLLEAVEPDKLVLLLRTIQHSGRPYAANLTVLPDDASYMNLVMDFLPEKDRFEFSNQCDLDGNTPLLLQAIHVLPLSFVEAFMKYCPPEKLIGYLNIINKKGETAIMHFVAKNSADPLKYILNLIPENEREDYFNFNNQGVKALLSATAYKSAEVKAVLESYGLRLPENLEKIKVQELRNAREEWATGYAFEIVHGESPWKILGLNYGVSLETIKRTVREKRLEFHPDKNLGRDTNEKIFKINQANDFLINPEIAKKYIKR